MPDFGSLVVICVTLVLLAAIAAGAYMGTHGGGHDGEE